MHTLQYTANGSSDFDQRFQNYVSWVQAAQQQTDPNGINVLGEPKFNCDGTVYGKGWCRPQNDGPASRAIAQISYAFWLLDQGRKSYVTNYLYGGGGGSNATCTVSNPDKVDCGFVGISSNSAWRKAVVGTGGGSNATCTVSNPDKVDCGFVGITQQQCLAKGCCWYEIDDNPNNYPWCYEKGGSGGGKGTIPKDLNYVMEIWNNGQSCDLWEEVRGTTFYTTMVQRYALYYGAALARALNDTSSASTWETAAASIDSTIEGFDHSGTIQDYSRTWDCSILVATLYGGTPDKFQPKVAEMFPPSNKDVLNTVSQLKSHWDGAYALNKEDDTNGIPGTLIGRYANDKYPGCSANGGSQGHAWILCSNALADIYYRNALYLHENAGRAKQILSPRHVEIYAELMEKDQSKAARLLYQYAREWQDSLEGGYEMDYEVVMAQIASMMATQGDNQLQRVAYHVGKSCGGSYHLAEQICETTSSNGGGLEVGAHDLTWSYGTVLSAWYYRGLAVDAGVEFWPAEKRIDEMVLAVVRYGLGQDCGAELCNSQCHD
eukprot:CAMPEP_0197075158 /NCGR_PEP_ID=MMETSP1384-20130603/211470_1 /TAXON_ID=29189 /ORGANISM="Ammonia sp." /LENGTH=547 /DNA_ID=CAMNT_0042514001 /DNA_START=1 /DNA_END=1645 /DNA_ORIENTATION=+